MLGPGILRFQFQIFDSMPESRANEGDAIAGDGLSVEKDESTAPSDMTSDVVVDPEASPTPEDVEPPDGGIAWLYVGCVFWINAHTWGLNSVILC